MAVVEQVVAAILSSCDYPRCFVSNSLIYDYYVSFFDERLQIWIYFLTCVVMDEAGDCCYNNAADHCFYVG